MLIKIKIMVSSERAPQGLSTDVSIFERDVSRFLV
jgi:hypothetical protein